MDEQLFMRLLALDSSDRYTVMSSCWTRYMEYLAEIARDIYDSCIQQYYDDYYPSVYDRHGNKEGFNLYKANEIASYELDYSILLDENNLLPYSGKEKRYRVLSTVMDGLRGGGARTRQFRGWPMSWHASYPNQFSQFGTEWSSSKTTMMGIFQDFVDNAIDQTEGYFWQLVRDHI